VLFDQAQQEAAAQPHAIIGDDQVEQRFPSFLEGGMGTRPAFFGQAFCFGLRFQFQPMGQPDKVC
jgi:hypothetical protein